MHVRPNSEYHHAVSATIPTQDELVPRVVFDPTGLRPAEQFESFREAAAPTFDSTAVTAPDSFSSITADYLVDDLVVSRICNESMTIRRDHRHLSSGGTDWVCVQYHLRGRFRGTYGRDGVLQLGAGDIGLLDLAHSFVALADRSDFISVLVPRTRLPSLDRLYSGGEGRRAPLTSERARAIRSAMSQLWTVVPFTTVASAPLVAERFVGVLDHALRRDALRETRAPLRRYLDTHIEANLDDPDLDVARLCDVANYSRSAVYRVYEVDGGVGSYIRSRRLARCLEELTSPQGRQRGVGAIATQWGFSNPSHFNRLFRSAYGFAPSQVKQIRDAGITPSGDPDPGIAVLRDWLLRV